MRARSADAPTFDGPRMTVGLYQNVIAYRTTGDTWVTADLWHPDGTHLTGYGIANVGLPGDGPQAGVRFNGPGAAILPGDRIALADPLHGTTTIDVPDVVADYDPAGHAIVVRAPEGAAVRAHLSVADRRGSDIVLDVTLTEAVGPGLIVHPLDAVIAADDVNALYGWVTVDLSDGIRYLVMVGSVSASLRASSPEIGGHASGPGNVDMTYGRASGGLSHRVEPLVGDGFWSWYLDAAPMPGDVLTLRYENPRLDIATTRVFPLVDADLVINPSTYAVTAHQPGLGSLRIAVRTVVAGSPSRTFPADASGHVTADLSTVVPRSPGHIVDAELRSTGLTWFERAPLPMVRVGIGVGLVGALGEIADVVPPAGMRTWDARNRPIVQQARFSRGSDGWAYADPSPPVMPGDRVEIEAFGGDPIRITAPELSAHYDVGSHSVVGTAPPGTPVTAVVRGYVGLPARTTTAGADGRFAVPLGPLADVRRGLHGTVDIGIDAATGAFTTWAAPRVGYTVGRSFVNARGAPGRVVDVTVTDWTGRLRFDQSMMLPNARLEWEATSIGTGRQLAPTDRFGRAITVSPGLRVTTTVAGDAPFGLIVPAVAFQRSPDGVIVRPDRPFAAADICADDLSTGREVCATSPDVDGARPPTRTSFHFTLDLGALDETTLTARLYTLYESATVAFTLPRLTVDADEGSVSAIGLAPNGRFRLNARRSGAEVAAATLDADGVGRGDARLETPAGQPIALGAGDVVEAVADDRTVVASVMVPAVSVARLDGGAVGGRITPAAPARLHVRVDRLFGPAESEVDSAPFSQAVATVDANGRFTATLTPTRDDLLAAVVTFTAHDGHGHAVIRRHHAPLLIVGVDSDTLCGATGVPGAPVHLALAKANGATITRTLQSGTSGWFSLRGGPTLRFAPGDRATVTIDGAGLGAPYVVAVDVPPLVVSRDRPQDIGHLHVVGARSSDSVFVLSGDDPACGEGPPTAFERRPSSSRVDATGRLGFIDTGLRVGHVRDFAFVPPDGGPILFRRYVAAGVRAHLDTGLIDVPLSPFSTGRLTVRDAAGRTRHVADVRTADVPLAPIGLPAAALPRTGDTILAAFDGVTDTIPIEPFAFEHRPDGTMVGHVAEPERVRVRFTLGDGRIVESAPSRLGEDAFALDAGAVGEVEAVFGAKVTTIEAVVVVTYGHELIRVPSAPGGAPSPTPMGEGVGPGAGGRIWLPFAQRYVRRR